MVRQLRVEYPGAVYHVMSRGNERKAIFRDDRDKDFFLSLFSRAKKKYGLIVHSYVLMDNHYHILLETPFANLSDIMKWINVTYTSRFNWRHKRSGNLFQGRFKSKLVEANDYMVKTSIYIHLNPLKAGMEKRLGSYPYSSIKDYIKAHKNHDIETNKVLGIISENREEAVSKYKQLLKLERMKKEEDNLNFNEIATGSIEFIQKIMNNLKKKGKTDYPQIRKMSKARITPEMVLKTVCNYFKTDRDSLNNRDSLNRTAKNTSIYLIKTYTSLTNDETGDLFGISKSGVTQCCFRLEKKMETDDKLKKTINQLQSQLEKNLF